MEFMNDAMKRIQSQELIGKFRSKEDVFSYLAQQVGLFLPTKERTKILFLKALLNEVKKAFKTDEIKMIEISNYPEITVKNLNNDSMSDPDIALYLPSKLQLSNQLPERNFFFGVLGTLKQEYLSEVIQETHKKNYSISPEKKEKQGIKISDSWLQELQKHNSSQVTQSSNFIEKSGTAIYLMKERSKINRERKSQVKQELSKGLFKDLQNPDEMNIDAGAGTKRRKMGPSKPLEEEKKEKPNPFMGQFNM